MKIPMRPSDSSANVLTRAFSRPIANDVIIYDNTLREGEQPPGVVFNSDEKLELATMMSEMGIPWTNAGFPAASPHEFNSVNRLAKAGLDIKLAGLCRMLDADIEKTVESGVDLVALFLGCSDTHLFEKTRWTEEQAVERIQAGVRKAKEQGALVSLGLEDSSRAPLSRIIKLFQAGVDAGVDYLVFADTVGILTPTATTKIVEIFTALFDTPIGTHFHNDLGLALANTLAALESGAKMAQVTVNGVGERTGNACLEELVVALHVKYGLDTGIDMSKLYDLCNAVHRASGTEPPAHKPVGGKLCFTHESGIHISGLLKNPECYQPYPPPMIGRQHELVFGKHSGGSSVDFAAKEVGLELSASARNDVLARIKTESEAKQGLLTDEMVVAWIREAAGQ